MNELTPALHKCLANAFVMYYQAHSYHWNVEGMHFSQYHGFFGDIYENVYGSIDDLAERIRIEGDYAPISLTELYKHSTIPEDVTLPDSIPLMVSRLYSSNASLIQCLTESFTLATAANKQGLADYLAGRIDAHKKMEWMLRASMKGN